ncbi:MAG: hypothetical protein LBQ50_13840 [Planctomycetaceae bacterium]|nr:hypothetical protein [Planctomycetaceae bacterium]
MPEFSEQPKPELVNRTDQAGQTTTQSAPRFVEAYFAAFFVLSIVVAVGWAVAELAVVAAKPVVAKLVAAKPVAAGEEAAAESGEHVLPELDRILYAESTAASSCSRKIRQAGTIQSP